MLTQHSAYTYSCRGAVAALGLAALATSCSSGPRPVSDAAQDSVRLVQLARTAVIQAYREAGTDGPVDVRTYVRVGDSLLIDFGDTTQAALHVRGGSARAIVVRDSLVRVELGQ